MKLVVASLVLTSSLFACGVDVPQGTERSESGVALADASDPGGRVIVVARPTDGADGDCTLPAQCNLRAAFAEALRATEPVTIALGVDAIMSDGEIALTPPAGRTDCRVSVVPYRRSTRQTITAGAAGSSRLLRVASGVTLDLTDVTIRDFSVTDPTGGGAILSAGTLRLRRVALANNAVTCFGTGAMTAFAACQGGAIASSGTLIVGIGTRFDGNHVTARAQTASFTNSQAGGGAIASTGDLTLEDGVIFADNVATAESSSGFHPMPGGASAASAGGAISNAGGTVTITAGSPGSCAFLRNAATAEAGAPSDVTFGARRTSSLSRGGAISSDGPIVERVLGACSYVGNTADEAPGAFVAPDAG